MQNSVYSVVCVYSLYSYTWLACNHFWHSNTILLLQKRIEQQNEIKHVDDENVVEHLEEKLDELYDLVQEQSV